ncbi:MAG: hypothetical protein FJ388_23675 [Verrucomicrobia bacterium]|nr:hypothetical protein [Verrucomicrobiota bacterium]
MSQQYNKVIKRHRRKAYVKRKKGKAKERRVAREAVLAAQKSSAPAPEPPPAAPESSPTPSEPPAAPEPPPAPPTTAA